MKSTLLLFLLTTTSILASSAQSSPEQVPDFEEDIAVLEASLNDSLSFEKIIERVKATRSDPRLSLQYIAFFEAMDNRYPEIKKNVLAVERLKANRYNELAWGNNQTKAELAFLQLDTADQIARKIAYDQGLWRNEYGRGVIHKNSGDYDQALTYFQKYLTNYSTPFDSSKVANVQYQIGVCLLYLGKLQECIETLVIVAELDEALERPTYAYNTLGIAYRKAKLYDKAEETYQKAYEQWKALENTNGQSRALLNIGNVKMETGEYTAAKSYFLRSVALDQGDDYSLAYSTENLGSWYLEAEQYDSAYYYLYQSYKIRKAFNNERELAIVEHQLARIHMARNQYSLAHPLLLSAYETVKKQGEQEKIKEISYDLSRWYEVQQNYGKALQYRDEFIAAKDSLLTESIAQAVADVSEKYETEQKERTIDQLNTKNQLQADLIKTKQQQLLLLTIGSILLAVLLIGIYGFYRRIRVQKRIIQKNLAEKELLLKEIHHRVKNNLQIISSLLRIQSRSISDAKAKEAIKESRSRVRSMALIHEDLYKENDLSGVYMPDYLGKLANDIFRIYNIVPDRFKLNTAIESLRLDVDTVIPIGLIVNELITNALKHAFPDKLSGTIELSLKEKENQLMLEVCDNGRGFKKPANKGSFGLSMIETFREKLDGKLQIRSEQGTSIRIAIGNYQKLEAVMSV